MRGASHPAAATDAHAAAASAAVSHTADSSVAVPPAAIAPFDAALAHLQGGRNDAAYAAVLQSADDLQLGTRSVYPSIKNVVCFLCVLLFCLAVRLMSRTGVVWDTLHVDTAERMLTRLLSLLHQRQFAGMSLFNVCMRRSFSLLVT